MPPFTKDRYYLEKKARRKSAEYPVATIAFYGPDNQFASKVVVGIVLSEKDEEAVEVKKWFSTGTDVRNDQFTLREMLDYIQSKAIQRVTMVERIVGCPHEEGIDYPLGEACPECPYWANRDRWTGKLLGES
jgi:hypothetical protein